MELIVTKAITRDYRHVTDFTTSVSDRDFATRMLDEILCNVIKQTADKITEEYYKENYLNILAKLDTNALINLITTQIAQKFAEEIAGNAVQAMRKKWEEEDEKNVSQDSTEED